MAQSINYSFDFQKDFDDLNNHLTTALNFGFIHESTVCEIDDSITDIFGTFTIHEAFDECEDKAFFIRVFRNAIYFHTNNSDLDEDEINQMIFDRSKNK